MNLRWVKSTELTERVCRGSRPERSSLVTSWRFPVSRVCFSLLPPTTPDPLTGKLAEVFNCSIRIKQTRGHLTVPCMLAEGCKSHPSLLVEHVTVTCSCYLRYSERGREKENCGGMRDGFKNMLREGKQNLGYKYFPDTC